MKNMRHWILFFVIVITNILLLLMIYKGLPLWLSANNPLVTQTSAILLGIISVLSSTGLIAYFFGNYQKSSENPEKENQENLKAVLEKQKKYQAMQIRQTAQYLITLFRLMTQKRFGFFRQLPCYLAISHKDAESERFFEKSGLDYLSMPNHSADSVLSDLQGFPCRWQISPQAVILNVDAEIQSDSYQWLGLLHFFKKFRKYKALNGIIINLNLPQFITQSEALTTEQLKETSKLIKMLYIQFGYNIPIYFIFTNTDAITGFHEFFADLNAEQRDQPWGIAFPTEGLYTVQNWLNYLEKEFDKLISVLNTRLFLRLETEKEMERRAQISCFSQQMELCRPALRKLMLQTNEWLVRAIYFTGNGVNGKTYNFAAASLSMRLELPLRESRYTAVTQQYFSKKILLDFILKEGDSVQTNNYCLKFKNTMERLRWFFAIAILSIGSIGFTTSYVHNSNSINAMIKLLPLYRQSYIALTSSKASLESPLDTLNILSSMQEYFQFAKIPVRIYFLGYEPFQIHNIVNNNLQEILSTQLMPRVLYRLGNILETNVRNPEILYEALKGYLVFSPLAAAHPEWIRTAVSDYLNSRYVNSPDIKIKINHYLNAALRYPVDHLPLDQALIEKMQENLRQMPPALFAYHELKSQSEMSQKQFRLDQKIRSDFDAVFAYRDPSQVSIPLLFTLKGFLNLHGKNTKELILHTANIYQILGLSNRDKSPELATEMSPQVWAYYNQDYTNAWNQYLSNIQVENFNDLNQAIQTLNFLTQSHNPLSEILEKIAENTQTIYGVHMTVAEEFSELNKFTGLPGKPSAQYKTLIRNFAALRDYLSNLSTAPDISQSEFQDASAYLQNKMPNNPILLLKRQAQQLPAPLNQWVNNIADNSFALVLQGAHHVINTAWQNTVMPVYQANIENRFPLNKQSDAEVNLNSFGEFFGNGGIFPQFFQTYLSPFINTSTAIWSEYKVGNYSLGLSASTIMQLEQADKIRDLYFSNNDKSPSIKFSIQPRVLDLESKSVYVQLSDQHFIYRHGPQQIFNWHWPAEGDAQQVSITFNDFSGKTFSITLNGLWALFRLLNATQLQQTGTPGHYIWSVNKNNHQASFDVHTGNNMPVLNLNILQNLNLPPEI